MIYESLNCITEEINQFFKNKLKIQDDRVVLSGIVNQDGTIAAKEENRVLITLINIRKETNVKNGTISSGVQSAATYSLPVSINLYVLFSAYFTSGNYSEALRFLSYVIAFLQDKNVFNKSNTPRLPDTIDKLIFEMENLETERLNNIWATLGAKYMPSVFYKVKMLTFNSAAIKEYRPAVSGISDNN